MSTDSGTAQSLTLFRVGGGWGGGGRARNKKASITSFSFVTSTNVGISSQYFLNFIFNNFAILVY